MAHGDGWGAAATPLALAVALLWAVHPLQTESVTYVVQRAESLVGLFYLLTLYGLVRGATAARPLGWYAVAALACLLGMATKEVMVSAPLVALLYDRTFLAGSFREAVRRRYGLYMALAATWPLLEQLIYASWGRGNTAGFDAGVNCWTYLGMQCQAIVHYLRLCAWPLRSCWIMARAWPKGSCPWRLRGRGRAAGAGHGRGALAESEARFPGGVLLRHLGPHVEHRPRGDAADGRASDVPSAGRGDGGRHDGGVCRLAGTFAA